MIKNILDFVAFFWLFSGYTFYLNSYLRKIKKKIMSIAKQKTLDLDEEEESTLLLVMKNNKIFHRKLFCSEFSK